MNEPKSREQEIREKLTAERKALYDKSFEEVMKFVESCKKYGDDYGGCVVAIGQAALAVMDHLGNEFGITGFQAGCINFEILRNWTYSGNKTSLKIVDFDDMLYPQYEHKFEKTITRSVWDALQKQAKERLGKKKDKGYAVHPEVLAHLQSIADGNVPFGYTVKEDHER